ncbi:MAG: hypothetical protein KZQ92_07595 [Candidatus Thiodiazotropha sp. (ex Lucinoma borealis)]|nr:hypothetical protein [Candidatus Thiodiazotropha sp. (ex Lucinoma borealis)]MCU7856898.1 hypothetical protein [Candidatus Thiodiazotropha sp. (ex Lucinoma borealis)]MCU7863827.1 hypothetical protein [Candidatus Thiodiazotropha sp. (ex Lucinoma borealis)]MCU7867682.1 hypothetical protein [Candidatus Thiodiazotropha sp. (ex Lucinoma borealis)]MCU7947129.1 hypothetical protein [Candidatus Thiodiazotropha sp. (ex Cardiolucina cf. quadrata)]
MSPIIICGNRKADAHTFILNILSIIFCQNNPYLKFRKYSISNYVKDIKEKDIELHFDDGGLTEATNGIVSKAPWALVVSYVLFKGNYFIELVGSLWAVVPSGSLNISSDTVGEAVEYLQSKNVTN